MPIPNLLTIRGLKKIVKRIISLGSLRHFALFGGHTHCFVCHQSSARLICQYCEDDAYIALFPTPGHNLLDHKVIYTHLKSPSYHGLYAIGEYSGLIAGLIGQLKFSGKALAANVLAHYFYQYLHLRLLYMENIPQALVPVPLSKLRHVKREYNQARLIAQALGKRFDIPVVDMLSRNRYTKQQSQLNREERLLNVEDAFSLAEPRADLRHIAIVDDVITTGSTINEACKPIANAYPDMHIDVWCIAISTSSHHGNANKQKPIAEAS